MTDYGSEDLVSMFEMPVRRTYELLTKQLREARRAKDVQVKVSLLDLGALLRFCY